MSECRNPALGALIDEYVDGALPEASRDALEQHLFECSECLEAVETRQMVVASFRASSRSGPKRVRGGMMAASLAIAAVIVGVAILVTVLRNGPSPSKSAFVLTLEGTVRAEGQGPTAPSGAPLSLVFRVPVPTGRHVSYDVRIVDGQGRVVREVGGLPPAGQNEVRADVGLLAAGTFEAVLREAPDGSGAPLELRYGFTIVAAKSR